MKNKTYEKSAADRATAVALVFDARTGEIVLTHAMSSITAELTGRKALSEEALDLAARLSGADAKSLRAMEAPADFDQHAEYAFDVKKGRLIVKRQSDRVATLGGLKPHLAEASAAGTHFTVRDFVAQGRLDDAVHRYYEQRVATSRLAAQADEVVRRLDSTRRRLAYLANDAKRKEKELEKLLKELAEISDRSFFDQLGGLFGDDPAAADTKWLLTALRTEVLAQAVKYLIRATER